MNGLLTGDWRTKASQFRSLCKSGWKVFMVVLENCRLQIGCCAWLRYCRGGAKRRLKVDFKTASGLTVGWVFTLTVSLRLLPMETNFDALKFELPLFVWRCWDNPLFYPWEEWTLLLGFKLASTPSVEKPQASNISSAWVQRGTQSKNYFQDIFTSHNYIKAVKPSVNKKFFDDSVEGASHLTGEMKTSVGENSSLLYLAISISVEIRSINLSESNLIH